MLPEKISGWSGNLRLHQSEEGLDALAIAHAGFFLRLDEACFVIPATLAHESVPSADVLLMGFATVLDAPFQNFLVAAALVGVVAG